MKTAYAVWETEYPDEGSVLVVRHSAKGALRWYRKATGERRSRDDLTPLSVCPLSVTKALALAKAGVPLT